MTDDDRVTVLSLLGTERTGWLVVYDDGERVHTDDAGLTASLHAAGGRLARVVNLDRVWAT